MKTALQGRVGLLLKIVKKGGCMLNEVRMGIEAQGKLTQTKFLDNLF